MKIVGIIIIAIGLVDLIGSYTGFDLWGAFVGVELPELLWEYSSFVEIGLGCFIMSLGKSNDDDDLIIIKPNA